MTALQPRREDIFVSIGVSGRVDSAGIRQALLGLAGRLDLGFRFWELLLVADEDDAEMHHFALSSLPNLRLLRVRNGTPGSHRCLCLAREAIGNIVVMTTTEEIDQVAVPDLIEQCEQTDSILTLRRRRANVINPLLVAFGRSAGFRVDLRDMATTAYPRALLNRILQHPDPALALRFPPSNNSLPVTVLLRETARTARDAGTLKRIGTRLDILRHLMMSSAPRVLSVIEIMSVTIAFGALLFAAYAIIVWLTFDFVQPGWFSTALVLSLVSMFLSFAIFGLSMGLERLLDLALRDIADDIIEELNPIDVFAPVMRELNVEIDAAAGRTTPGLGEANGGSCAAE